MLKVITPKFLLQVFYKGMGRGRYYENAQPSLEGRSSLQREVNSVSLNGSLQVPETTASLQLHALQTLAHEETTWRTIPCVARISASHRKA